MAKKLKPSEANHNVLVLRKWKRRLNQIIREMERWEKHILKMEKVREKDRLGGKAEAEVARENYRLSAAERQERTATAAEHRAGEGCACAACRWVRAEELAARALARVDDGEPLV